MKSITLVALLAVSVAALPAYRPETDLEARSVEDDTLFIRDELDDSLVARDDFDESLIAREPELEARNKPKPPRFRARPSGAGPVMGGMADMTAQIVDWRWEQ